MHQSPLVRQLRVDQRTARRQHLSTVLTFVRDAGGNVSRVRIAEGTGLPRATVSSVVGELTDLGLVDDHRPVSAGVGRPAQPISLLGSGARAVGVVIGADGLSVSVVDLCGAVLDERRLPLDLTATPATAVVDRDAASVAASITDAIPATELALLTGVSVAVPGLVELDSGRLVLAPDLGWSDVPLADLVRTALADTTGRQLPVAIDTETNLAAIAEARELGPRGRELLLVSGGSTVGAGIIIGGQLVHGHTGFAADVGHLPMELAGAGCGCGRRGCWATRIGFHALVTAVAEVGDRLLDPNLDRQSQLAEILQRANRNDPRTLAGLEQLGTWLGFGAATLVSLLDPGVLVLGGYFADLAPWILEPVRRELDGRVLAATARRYDVRASTLGPRASLIGATQTALRSIFADPAGIAGNAANVLRGA